MRFVHRQEAAFFRFGRAIVCASVGVFLCLPASALNPDRLISQYAHSAWRTQDGFFDGAPTSITQTSDGYLWVGTFSGIVRFDGVRFVPWNPPGDGTPRSAFVNALLGTRDGALWIGTMQGGWSRWANGRLTSYPEPSASTIGSFLEDGKETAWLTRKSTGDDLGSVCEVTSGQVRCYGESNGIPRGCCNALAKDSTGAFWLTSDAEVLKWVPRSSSARRWKISGAAEVQTHVVIAPLTDDSAWIGVDVPGPGKGLELLSHGTYSPLISGGWDSSSVGVRALLTDRHHAIWVGTNDHGLYRLRDGKVDHFGSADGLSSDFVQAVFEDREGNLWVVTTKGIDCFRDLAVSSFSKREGLSAHEIDTVLAARDGTVWAGGDRGLDALRESGISSLSTGEGLAGTQVTSLLEDLEGRFWVGIDHTMTILKDGRFNQIRRPDGRELGFVVGMAEDIDHDVWVEISGTPRELIRIHNLQVTDRFPAPQMPAARRVAADPAGGIWLGLMSGDMARYRQGKLETFHFQHQTESPVIEITVNPDGSVLAATRFGLLGWRDRKQQVLTVRNGLPCDGIDAFIKDSNAALWLYSQCGLVQIAEQELQKWWADAGAVLQMRVFASTDGTQGGPASFQGAARSTDGKLWFSNGVNLQMIDPIHLPVNTIPPPVRVEEVTADRHSFSGANLRFPALTRDIAIRYAALSFVAPQKVRFRYMLEGQDKTWQEAGTRREAFYTNLAPGSYRFRVIACNNDGLWNEAGDSLSFMIAPAYYQTDSFVFLCTGAFFGGLWLLYVLRLKQATAQIQQRIGTRLEERERIARELHDTLLQGFQGLMLRFQAVMKVLPDHGPARTMMEQVLDRADEVLLEGRQRVRDLREEGLNGNELSQALTRCGEELSQEQTSSFRLSVLGTPQPLDPIVFNDVNRIAKEALVNAFQHAKAARIEVELAYSDVCVCLRIRDDGTGIDPVVLNSGKTGHWGLSGMRERAEKIGAQLKIWSQAGAGTEVELTIAARIAYPRIPRGSLWSRIRAGASGAGESKTL
jgi:signal transduction histidine kinase/ligand-binding sensor domain-containing protein